MTYINNNNSQTEKYFLGDKKSPESKYYPNPSVNFSQEYLDYNDPDYSSLLKHYKQDTNSDDVCISKPNSALYDFTASPANYFDYPEEPERNSHDKWSFSNEKRINLSDSVLNASDDEALENYLNDLAKNYDDIDRRIRNAENFVNQIEECQTSQYNSFNCYNKSKIPTFNVKNDEKKVKYVTELRVNIADKANHEMVAGGRENLYSSCRISPQFSNSLANIRKVNNTPIIRNSQLISAKHKAIDDKNTSKSKYICANQNYASVVNERHSSKSYSSSVSNSAKFDLEFVNIPPPKVFCSNYIRQEALSKDKQVQTNDCIKNRNNIFSTSAYEDRAAQTISSLSCILKTTVDICVGTESDYFKPRLKPEVSLNQRALSETECDSSERDESIAVSKPTKPDYTEILIDQMDLDKNQLKSSISRKAVNINTSKTSRNQINFKANHINKTSDLPIHNNNKIGKWKRSSTNGGKLTTGKPRILSPSRVIINDENDNKTKLGFFEVENLETKDSAKNASMEIQRLLENLGSHLQASMSMREPRAPTIKSPLSTESSTASFWDNPLHKNDLISAKITPTSMNTIKQNDASKKVKRTNNMINSELQAICKTMEKNKKYEMRPVNNPEPSTSDNESSNSVPKNLPTLRSESMDVRQIRKPAISPNGQIGSIKKSSSNINISGDVKFPSHFKTSRSFELNPYDDIIKAHLSPLDRRIKSVAAKNGCGISIDGPINSYDPLSCQAFRNKVTYRCTVAGPNKENLEKCMNYLKETFPNTFLKVNARSLKRD